MNTLENEIFSLVKKLPQIARKEKFTSDKDWTMYLKNEICKLGIEKEFEVSTSGIENYSPEWLFDIVWYKNNSKGYLIKVPLALESEWKMEYGEIAYDFEKLLVSKAEHRVMIFQGNNEKTINECFSKLKEQVICFNGNKLNERYLLLAYNKESECFLHKLIVV